MNRNHAWAVSLNINCTCTIDAADTFGVVRLTRLARMRHDGYEKSRRESVTGSDAGYIRREFLLPRDEHVWHNVRTDKYRTSAVDCRICEILAATFGRSKI